MKDFETYFFMIVGMFVALVGVKIKFIKANTWIDVFGYIISVIVGIIILEVIDRKIIKRL